MIKTLEEQHIVTANALRETMKRLEAAKRKRTALQTDLNARYAAAEEHATGLLEGKQTLLVALKDVITDLNEQQILSPLF